MREAQGLTAGILLGAGVMYFLDPRRGGARRALVRDKSLKAAHEVEHAAAVGARDLENRAAGVVARLKGEKGPVDPEVLGERVRAALGRVCSHPSAIAVTAKGAGCIELKGPVLASEIEDVLLAVARVPGVESIDDDLEVHDGPGDIPALQGEPVRRSRLVRVAPAAKLIAGIVASGVAIGSVISGHPVGLLLGGGGVLAIARSMKARSEARRWGSTHPRISHPEAAPAAS